MTTFLWGRWSDDDDDEETAAAAQSSIFTRNILNISRNQICYIVTAFLVKTVSLVSVDSWHHHPLHFFFNFFKSGTFNSWRTGQIRMSEDDMKEEQNFSLFQNRS